MESLSNIMDLIKSCLLPELTLDLDSIPIELDHFKSYQEYLEIHLPLLYDIIQHDPNKFVCNGETNETKQEIQVYLMVLLFEVSSLSSAFKLNNTQLIQNADRILQNFIKLEKDVDDLIVKYYENNLHKNKWKRQLGAVHGFVKYLHFRFSSTCDLDKRMNTNFSMFCLSAAINIRSYYETHYKSLSTDIFIIILQHGINDDIINMNIHSVIYDAVFKDIFILDSVCFNVKQWNCLIKCLDFYKDFDSFTWSHLDDMMEVLLRNISLSPDSTTALCLLKFVKKLMVYFTIDRREFEKFFDEDLTLLQNINEYRLCNINTSYTCYRWAKNILQMFIIESYKLLQEIEIATEMLQEIHKIYILAILPISLSVVEPHLTVFLEKYISVLMEAVKVHKYQDDIMRIVTALLETFSFHLQSTEGSEILQKFKENIYKLLKTQYFMKFALV